MTSTANSDLMTIFADPNAMHSLSFADKMAGTGITALLGMGITFLILILLWGIVALVNAIMSKAQGGAAKKTAVSTAPVAQVATPVASESATNDAELVAVIMAAIAASCGTDVDTGGLVIKRIKRVSGSSPSWAKAGRNESISNSQIV